MRLLCGTFLFFLLLSGCANFPYNPSKPEMSVPENSSYKAPPKTFNQFRKDWEN